MKHDTREALIQFNLFDYLLLTIFSFTFYNKFVEMYKLFSCKKQLTM
jgi:hypothetical protein